MPLDVCFSASEARPGRKSPWACSPRRLSRVLLGVLLGRETARPTAPRAGKLVGVPSQARDNPAGSPAWGALAPVVSCLLLGAHAGARYPLSALMPDQAGSGARTTWAPAGVQVLRDEAAGNRRL